jgi:hypothetical protein
MFAKEDFYLPVSVFGKYISFNTITKLGILLIRKREFR